MRTISHGSNEWDKIWDLLAKDYSALSMGTALGFSIRRQVELIEMDDAPAGYERITIHLDFEKDEDYTLFVLKYQ